MTWLTVRIPACWLTGITLSTAILAGSIPAKAQNEGEPAEARSAPEMTETIYLANLPG